MTVTQLQYTAWPDHDVPKSATPLIEISRTLKSLQGSRKQQVLIHCRSQLCQCYLTILLKLHVPLFFWTERSCSSYFIISHAKKSHKQSS